MGLIRDIQLANRQARAKDINVLKLVDSAQAISYALEKARPEFVDVNVKRAVQQNESDQYAAVNSPLQVETIEQKRGREQSEAEQYASQNRVTQRTAQGRVKLSTTEGRLYFIALGSLDRLDIQFVPDQLTINRNPNIANIQVIGRNNPIYHFISGDTVLNFELDFHAMEENRQDVIRKCRWMEHLAYNNGFQQEPEKVKLVFGDVFRDEVWTVTRVSYSLSNFNKQKGFLPQQAYVQVQLSLDPVNNLGWEDIRSDNNNPHLGPTNGRA